eukprot:14683576-Alexandrium_andersonii.AAC.1
MPFKELRKEHAAWVAATWTPASWRAARGGIPHEIFTLDGITIYTMQADYMHCKHLGCDQYYMASVLALLVVQVLPGSAVRNMEKLFEEVKEFYQQHKTASRFHNLTLNMIKGNVKKGLASAHP